MTIQLILQLKIFDQVYLFSIGGRPNDNMVLVYYVFQKAFQQNQGGRAAAVAVTLFVLVVVVYVALTNGPVAGLLTGTIAGLLQDALATGIIGIGGLAKTLAGFAELAFRE